MTQPDAVLKHVRNLQPGMVAVGYGKLLAIKEHKRDYFDVTWDIEGPEGHQLMIYMDGSRLVTVITEP